MIADVSKYSGSISVATSAHTEYANAASVPIAISVSMFAVRPRARIAAPFRKGQPA